KRLELTPKLELSGTPCTCGYLTDCRRNRAVNSSRCPLRRTMPLNESSCASSSAISPPRALSHFNPNRSQPFTILCISVVLLFPLKSSAEASDDSPAPHHHPPLPHPLRPPLWRPLHRLVHAPVQVLRGGRRGPGARAHELGLSRRVPEGGD